MSSARLAGRRTVAIVMTALMCAGSAHASGPGEAAPWYLDQFGGSRADLARRYDGDIGVVMARAPKPLLYLDWRILHHQRVGKEAGFALSRPCCDAAPTPYGTPTSTSRWLDARKAVAGAPEAKPYLETSRPGPNYTSKPTCFDDAFDTATTTLQDRIKRFGAGAPAVKAWLLTQDAVFDACSRAEAALPPPLAASPVQLWRAFQAVESDKVKGLGGTQLADLVTLVRHALTPEFTLLPYAEEVRERYQVWLMQHDAKKTFTAEQREWLDRMAEHIATSLTIEPDDFQDGWFGQHGNLKRAHTLFGDRLQPLLAELNESLAA